MIVSAPENANWRFDGSVSETFDDHVSKSVPFYYEGHDLIAKLSDFFVADGSQVYEIGCSTGQLSKTLAEHNSHKDIRVTGIDPIPTYD